MAIIKGKWELNKSLTLPAELTQAIPFTISTIKNSSLPRYPQSLTFQPTSVSIDGTHVTLEGLAAEEFWNFEDVGSFNSYFKAKEGLIYADCSASSYAYATLNFEVDAICAIEIEYSQKYETSFDYGIFSKLDKELTANYKNDGENVYHSARRETGKNTVTYTNVTPGKHFITIKYIEDGSNSSTDKGADAFELLSIKAKYNSGVVYDSAVLVDSIGDSCWNIDRFGAGLNVWDFGEEDVEVSDEFVAWLSENGHSLSKTLKGVYYLNDIEFLSGMKQAEVPHAVPNWAIYSGNFTCDVYRDFQSEEPITMPMSCVAIGFNLGAGDNLLDEIDLAYLCVDGGPLTFQPEQKRKAYWQPVIYQITENLLDRSLLLGGLGKIDFGEEPQLVTDEFYEFINEISFPAGHTINGCWKWKEKAEIEALPEGERINQCVKFRAWELGTSGYNGSRIVCSTEIELLDTEDVARDHFDDNGEWYDPSPLPNDIVRLVDFGDEQPVSEAFYNYLIANAERVELSDYFVQVEGEYEWNEQLSEGVFAMDNVGINGITYLTAALVEYNETEAAVLNLPAGKFGALIKESGDSPDKWEIIYHPTFGWVEGSPILADSGLDWSGLVASDKWKTISFTNQPQEIMVQSRDFLLANATKKEEYTLSGAWGMNSATFPEEAAAPADFSVTQAVCAKIVDFDLHSVMNIYSTSTEFTLSTAKGLVANDPRLSINLLPEFSHVLAGNNQVEQGEIIDFGAEPQVVSKEFYEALCLLAEPISSISGCWKFNETIDREALEELNGCLPLNVRYAGNGMHPYENGLFLYAGRVPLNEISIKGLNGHFLRVSSSGVTIDGITHQVTPQLWSCTDDIGSNMILIPTPESTVSEGTHFWTYTDLSEDLFYVFQASVTIGEGENQVVYTYDLNSFADYIDVESALASPYISTGGCSSSIRTTQSEQSYSAFKFKSADVGIYVVNSKISSFSPSAREDAEITKFVFCEHQKTDDWRMFYGNESDFGRVMDFGDEPQYIPTEVYDFIVANAEPVEWTNYIKQISGYWYWNDRVSEPVSENTLVLGALNIGRDQYGVDEEAKGISLYAIYPKVGFGWGFEDGATVGYVYNATIYEGEKAEKNLPNSLVYHSDYGWLDGTVSQEDILNGVIPISSSKYQILDFGGANRPIFAEAYDFIVANATRLDDGAKILAIQNGKVVKVFSQDEEIDLSTIDQTLGAITLRQLPIDAKFTVTTSVGALGAYRANPVYWGLDVLKSKDMMLLWPVKKAESVVIPDNPDQFLDFDTYAINMGGEWLPVGMVIMASMAALGIVSLYSPSDLLVIPGTQFANLGAGASLLNILSTSTLSTDEDDEWWILIVIYLCMLVGFPFPIFVKDARALNFLNGVNTFEDNSVYIPQGWGLFLASSYPAVLDCGIGLPTRKVDAISGTISLTSFLDPVTETKTIYENGTYSIHKDAVGFSSVTVSVPAPSGTLSIAQNGTFNVTDYASVTVDIPATASLTYNDTEWFSMSKGQTGTINCAGTEMEGNIVITLTSPTKED